MNAHHAPWSELHALMDACEQALVSGDGESLQAGSVDLTRRLKQLGQRWLREGGSQGSTLSDLQVLQGRFLALHQAVWRAQGTTQRELQSLSVGPQAGWTASGYGHDGQAQGQWSRAAGSAVA